MHFYNLDVVWMKLFFLITHCCAKNILTQTLVSILKSTIFDNFLVRYIYVVYLMSKTWEHTIKINHLIWTMAHHSQDPPGLPTSTNLYPCGFSFQFEYTLSAQLKMPRGVGIHYYILVWFYQIYYPLAKAIDFSQ